MKINLRDRGNRFVAFFDILGFSDLLPFYREIIYDYLGTIEDRCKSNGIDFLVFSDNAVLYSKKITKAWE